MLESRNLRMAETIKKLTIEGYKSIRKVEDFPLGALNVLIGANGAGKSNFVGFFRLLKEIVEQRLQLALQTTEGGADGCLFLGLKITSEFAAELYFGDHLYEFALAPATGKRAACAEGTAWVGGDPARMSPSFGAGHSEVKLEDFTDDRFTQKNVREFPGA